jgi:bifunctional UDP-N-acetylglucosamine pyrophosphorylase/glucosamine-1-phosphate N-acetyltransferase
VCLNNSIIGSDVSNLKSLGNNNTIINCQFIGADIVIENNCTLKNCIVADKTTITDSYLENSLIGKNCSIGPFARMRGTNNVADNCKIGNFVELKNSQLGFGVKVAHLSYIGDAIIGDRTNIGCGVVFANYNGITKNISIVGKDCFIGSNVNIVAPVNIANNTFVCAGTTITEDTADGSFMIGRVKAEEKPGYRYYLKNKVK